MKEISANISLFTSSVRRVEMELNERNREFSYYLSLSYVFGIRFLCDWWYAWSSDHKYEESEGRKKKHISAKCQIKKSYRKRSVFLSFWNGGQLICTNYYCNATADSSENRLTGDSTQQTRKWKKGYWNWNGSEIDFFNEENIG